MTGTATRVRPRPVYCPIEHEHRDLTAADDARAGRFRNAGVTLDLGPHPSWRHDGLADDEEWHIEWSKFYVGLDLAHAFAVTGDDEYVACWRRLVEGWIDQREPDADPSDVTARRLQNWLYAWQVFDRAPGFPGLGPELEARLLASAAAQLEHVAATLTPERNHRTLELYALLVVSLALPPLDPDGTRARQAWAALEDNLLTDVWADGVHRERSSHYHLIALRSFVAARVNVLRYGGEVSPAYDERLRSALRFALHLHRPDGQIPALSDSDSGSYHDLLLVAGRALDLPELRYVAAAGREGWAPAERNVSFDVGGYHVQRSGWGDHGEPVAEERFLVFGCGPLGDGGHGHYDALAVEAYAHGRPLVVDPGRCTYAEGNPNWRRWFKGTAAHNTVTVDGLDQQPYRRGRPRGPQLRCRLLDRAGTDGLHLLRGEVRTLAYDAVHRRTVVLVADEYWLVHDELRAPTEHDYVLRWHLAAGPAPHLSAAHPGSPARIATPSVALEVAGRARVAVEPGWVSPEYGVRLRAPLVAAAAPRGPDADLVTLLSGRVEGEVPRLRDVSTRTGVAVVAGRDGSVDHVGLLPGAEVEAGGLAVSGTTVWLRVAADGRLDRAAVRHLTKVTWTGAGAPPRLAGSADDWHVWRRDGAS